MTAHIILASGSEIRARLLENAGLTIEVRKPRVDEEALKASMTAAAAPPRDIADALAQLKASKIASRAPDAWVIGCDQVLAWGGKLLSKPSSPDQAVAQLADMRGTTHSLFSAAVVCHDGVPVWRHVGRADLHMRDFSNAYLDDYVTRNWNSIRHSVGAYKLEEEGVRLFDKVDGDYFTVLGMPLLELLDFLALRGVVAS